MLDYFYKAICPRTGSARRMNLNCDSCTGKYKNIFVLAYIILRVVHGSHDEISWKFMEVGDSKCRPGEEYVNIRKTVVYELTRYVLKSLDHQLMKMQSPTLLMLYKEFT